MALSYTDRGGTALSGQSDTTLVCSPTSNFTTNGLAVLVIAYDNSGSSGADPYSSIADSLGNTWTARHNTLRDPGVASAGCVLRIFTSEMNYGLITTGDSVTVTTSANVGAYAYAFWQLDAAAGSKATYLTTGTGAGGASTTPSVTSSSIASNDVIIGAVANEYGTAQTLSTPDADTTNGSWSTNQYYESGSTTSGMNITTQAKLTTGASAQTYNLTMGTSTDWAAGWISIDEVAGAIVYNKKGFGQAQTTISAAPNTYPRVGSITDVFRCGAECAALADWTSKTATIITRDTGLYRSGAASIKIAAAGAETVAKWTTTAVDTWVARFSIYLDGLPAADAQLVSVYSTTVNDAGLAFDAATGKLCVVQEGVWASRVLGPTLANQTWTTIDLYVDGSPTYPTIDWRVNDVAQTRLTFNSTIHGTLASFWIGQAAQADFPANTTYTAYYDDIVISNTAADYPINNGYVAAGETWINGIEGPTFAQAQAKIKIVGQEGFGQALATITASSATYYSTIMADSPVAYWRLGESSGTLYDSSGNGRNSTSIVGTAYYSETGALTGDSNTAVRFAASSWAIVPSASFQPGDGPLTFECWFKRSTLGASGWLFGNRTVSGTGMAFGVANTGEVMGMGGASIYWFFSPVDTTDDYLWHHFVITKNGSTRTGYLDGSALTNVNESSSYTHSNTSDVWTIGSTGNRDSSPFAGTIDEVAIYYSVLTPTQVAAHYAARTVSGITTSKSYAQAQAKIKVLANKAYAQAQVQIAAVGGGGPAYVQSCGSNNTLSSVSSLAISTSKTITVGNTIVVSVAMYADKDASIGVTDNLGNIYTLKSSVAATSPTRRIYQFVAPITTGGTLTTITAAWTTAITNITIIADEFSGLGTASDGGEASGTITTMTWFPSGTISANGAIVGAAFLQDPYNHFAGAASGSPSTSITLTGDPASTDPNLSQAYAIAGGSDVTGFVGTTTNNSAGGYAWIGTSVKFAATTGGATYYDTIIADSPIAYWRLGESSGIVADNAQGTAALDGAYVNTPTLGVTGALTGDADTAATFTATSSEHVLVTHDAALDVGAGAWSVECWFKTTANAGPYGIFSMGYLTPCLWLYHDGTYGTDISLIISADSSADGARYTSATLNNGAWHHAVATHDVSHNYKLYVDGADVTTVVGTPAADYNIYNLTIGAQQNAGTPRWFFDGTLDEVAFYGSVLTLSQVQAHYTAGTSAGPTTSRSYAQTQARIKQTYQVWAQGNSWIKVRDNESFAQGQGRIKQSYQGYAQGKADIKTKYTVYAQAQSQIKTTYKVSAQAQSQIKQSYLAYAQPQAQIKQVYKVFAQANAWIKVTLIGVYAQGQARVKQVYQNFGQGQADIKQTYQGFGQSLAYIRLTQFSYAQARTIIRTTVLACAQAQADIEAISKVYAQAQVDIKQVYQVYGQSQGQIKQSYKSYAQAQTTIKQVYMGFGQANSYIKLIQLAPAQSQAHVRRTEQVYAQANTYIKLVVFAYAQSQVAIKQTYRAISQVNASIIFSNLISSAQAQADIKQTYPYTGAGFVIITTLQDGGPSQNEIQQITVNATDGVWYLSWGVPDSITVSWNITAEELASELSAKLWKPGWNIEQVSITKVGNIYTVEFINERGLSNQSQLVASYFEWSLFNTIGPTFAQSQTQTKQTYKIYAQSQAKLNAFAVQAYAQAQVNIKGIDIEGLGQAQAKINTFAVQNYGQAQTDIKQIYKIYAQAQVDIKATNLVFAQARTQIRQQYLAFGQSQTTIKATYQGYGQTQAQVILSGSLGYAQSQAVIKQIYQVFAQAQATVRGNAFGQTQTSIKQVYQSYAQSQADIKVITFAYAQARTAIKQTYIAFAQSQTDIKASYAVYGQAQVYIRLIGQFGLGQAQVSIKQIYTVYGQAQVDIKQTYIVSAQAQARIKQIYLVSAQAQSDIKSYYMQYGQSRVSIKQTFLVSAQAQTYIKIVNILAQAQAQANIRQTYQQYAQTQTRILAFGINRVAQAQTNIMSSGNFAQAQAQARIYAFGTIYCGQAQAQIKQAYQGYGQSDVYIKVTGIFVHTQAQARIKQVYLAFGQAQVAVKGNAFGQAQSEIKQIYQVYASAQTTIKQIYLAYANTQVSIKASSYAYGNTQAWIEATYQQYAQTQALIKQIYLGFAQVNAYIKVINILTYAQAQADIQHTYYSWAQTQAKIISFNVQQFANAATNIRAEGNFVIGQSQARIYAFNYPQFAQAQIVIKQTYKSYANAQGWIKQVYVPVAQAQADINTNYQVYAQAEANVRQVYLVWAQANAHIVIIGLQTYAQALADITDTYRPTGQASVNIRRTEYAYAQAQVSILQSYLVSANAQASIVQFYQGYGQSSVVILAAYFAVGQAVAKINAYDVQQFAQATLWVSGSAIGPAQAQAKINAFDVQAYAQASGTIKSVSLAYAQTQVWIISKYQAYGQAGVEILSAYQEYGQAQALIQAVAQSYAQVNAQIKQTYQIHGQTQGLIRTTHLVHAQAQAQIYLVGQSYGQAATAILQTYQAHAQARTQILGLYTYRKYANAQALIKTTVMVYAQTLAQIILSGQSQNGQAEALIRTQYRQFGQALAYIQIAGFVYGQANALILKSAGYGQAQTSIAILHQLKRLVIGDRQNIILVIADKAMRLEIDDREITEIVGDKSSFDLEITDRTGLTLTITDVEF